MKKIIFIILLSLQPLFSQNFSISIKTNYTTTSRLYPDISKNTGFTFDSYSSIDGIWGLGAEIRKNIFEDRLYLGLSGEYVAGKANTISQYANLYYSDGYQIFLIELNGFLIIPLSSETFKIYIGGGINTSFGYRLREIQGISVNNLNNPLSTGIQVLTGLEYFFSKNLSLRWEMKFRDPEIETESKFTQNLIYNNLTYQLPKDPIKSKINLDGVVFDFSIAYNF